MTDRPWVAMGDQFVVRVGRYVDEAVEDLELYTDQASAAGIPRPDLVASGDADGTWWVLQQRIPGEPGSRDVRGLERALVLEAMAAQLASLHRDGPAIGPRQDEPERLAISLYGVTKLPASLYDRVVRVVIDGADGEQLRAVHLDACVGSTNVLVDNGTLSALIDPHPSCRQGSAAWEVAVIVAQELVCGEGADGFLVPYWAARGPADGERVAALLPAAMLLRTNEALRRGRRASAERGRAWLERHGIEGRDAVI